MSDVIPPSEVDYSGPVVETGTSGRHDFLKYCGWVGLTTFGALGIGFLSGSVMSRVGQLIDSGTQHVRDFAMNVLASNPHLSETANRLQPGDLAVAGLGGIAVWLALRVGFHGIERFHDLWNRLPADAPQTLSDMQILRGQPSVLPLPSQLPQSDIAEAYEQQYADFAQFVEQRESRAA